MRPASQRGDDGQVLVRAFEFKTRVGTDRPTSLRATVAHVTTIPRFLASCTRCSKMKNRNHKLLIFHLDWPVKKDPHKSGFPPSQANPSGKLALPTGNFGTRPFLCLKSYKLSSKGRVQKLPLRVCWPFLVPQEVDRTKGYIGS